mmetsp:Transcript_42479/g.121075  ORF Transcript_42479/g.121075 Transcript_42479/m.121075 type:complete len:226 (+) Transcript_42479:486-1163(+)
MGTDSPSAPQDAPPDECAHYSLLSQPGLLHRERIPLPPWQQVCREVGDKKQHVLPLRRVGKHEALRPLQSELQLLPAAEQRAGGHGGAAGGHRPAKATEPHGLQHEALDKRPQRAARDHGAPPQGLRQDRGVHDEVPGPAAREVRGEAAGAERRGPQQQARDQRQVRERRAAQLRKEQGRVAGGVHGDQAAREHAVGEAVAQVRLPQPEVAAPALGRLDQPLAGP